MARIQKSVSSAAVAAAVTALSAPAAAAADLAGATPARKTRARAADGTRLPDHDVVPSIEALLRGEKQVTAYIVGLGVPGKVKFQANVAWADLGEATKVVTVYREAAGAPKSGQTDAIVRVFKSESGDYVADVVGGDVEGVIGQHVFADDDAKGIVAALITENKLWSGAKASAFAVKTRAPATAEV
jgi:hypothetical protein